MTAAIKPGDHVQYTHKYRTSYGIVVDLVAGLFGEPRAHVYIVRGEPQPFAVCVDGLTPDTAGVVLGVIRARYYSDHACVAERESMSNQQPAPKPTNQLTKKGKNDAQLTARNV